MKSIANTLQNHKLTNSAKKTNNPSIKNKYNCKKCYDTGYVLSGTGIDTKASMCNCLKTKIASNKVKSSKISKLSAECTFEKFNLTYYADKIIDGYNLTYKQLAEIAFEATVSFVNEILNQQIPESLILLGNTGRGKTFLAASVANEIIKHNKQKQILFVVVPDLLNELRYSYERNSGTNEADILNTARNSDVLILDDLGAHTYTDWVKEKIYSIIDYRLNEKLPTIITSNLSDTESMDQVLGARTTSRIFQLCNVYRLLSERDIRILIADRQMEHRYMCSHNNN